MKKTEKTILIKQLKDLENRFKAMNWEKNKLKILLKAYRMKDDPWLNDGSRGDLIK